MAPGSCSRWVPCRHNAGRCICHILDLATDRQGLHNVRPMGSLGIPFISCRGALCACRKGSISLVPSFGLGTPLCDLFLHSDECLKYLVRPILTMRCDADKFTGKERDPESGLDNFLVRYFTSNLGRFTSPDSTSFAKPINPQMWNLYSYAL